MALKPRGNTILDLQGDGWVDEVGGADLHRGGSSHEELYGILGGHYATKANHRNVDSLVHVVNHADGNRFHSWATESARADRQFRATMLNVDGHAHKGVDERNGVGSLSLACTSYV